MEVVGAPISTPCGHHRAVSGQEVSADEAGLPHSLDEGVRDEVEERLTTLDKVGEKGVLETVASLMPAWMWYW